MSSHSLILYKQLLRGVRYREYQVSVFLYQVYLARLRECLLNHKACRAIQHAFSKLSLVNLIAKDMNLVFYLSVYKLVHSSN